MRISVPLLIVVSICMQSYICNLVSVLKIISVSVSIKWKFINFVSVSVHLTEISLVDGFITNWMLGEKFCFLPVDYEGFTEKEKTMSAKCTKQAF